MIDQYTKLLLHMDDSTFKDECGHTVTNTGVALDTTVKKFGSSSTKFSGGVISIPYSDDFIINDGIFTIDCWVYGNFSSSSCICGRWETVVGQGDFMFSIESRNLSISLGTYSEVNFFMRGLTTLQDNVWYHVAFVGDGSKYYIFVNGVLDKSIESNLRFKNLNRQIEIGRYSSTNKYPLSGYIDEFRISKGIARWTSNFTPPISSYGVTEININNTNINIYPNVYRNKENKLGYQITHPDIKKSFIETNSVVSTVPTTLGSGRMFSLPIDQSRWTNISNLIIK